VRVQPLLHSACHELNTDDVRDSPCSSIASSTVEYRVGTLSRMQQLNRRHRNSALRLAQPRNAQGELMSRSHVAIVFCVFVVACGGMTPRIAPATDDATLTVRVRTALLNDPAVHASEITVMAQNGVVILRGQVHGQSEANAAIAAARRIEGVRDVQSELQPNR